MSRRQQARLWLCAMTVVAMAAGCSGGSDNESDSGGASSTIDLNADSADADADGGEATTGAAETEDEQAESNDVADSPEPVEGDVDPAPPLLVTATSFGPAELCMTRDDLEAALPDLVVGPYEEQGALVDTEGVTVTDPAGNVEFYAMAIVGEGPALSLFYSDNARYRTGEGVGPGTELGVASSVYGPATLSYNVEAESREYVAFAAGPADIGFRTGTGPEAGIYETDGGFNETEEYEPQALIQAIEIFSRDC